MTVEPKTVSVETATMATAADAAAECSKRVRLKGRNEKIRDEYRKQFEKGYRHDFIVKQLENIYFLSRDTLERIVFKSGTYKDF